MYWIYKNVVTKSQAGLLLGDVDWSLCQSAKLGGSDAVPKKTERITDVVFLSTYSLLGCLLSEHIRDANASAGWKFDITGIEPLQLGRYGKGGHYFPHHDCNLSGAVAPTSRKLTGVLMLSQNRSYVGGLLQFPEDIETAPIFEFGNLVVFPSYCKHVVTPVTKGTRITATAWMNGPAFK